MKAKIKVDWKLPLLKDAKAPAVILRPYHSREQAQNGVAEL